MSSRTTVRVSVGIAGLLLELVALRGWHVAQRQYDAPGEGLAHTDSAEATQEYRRDPTRARPIGHSGEALSANMSYMRWLTILGKGECSDERHR